MFPYNEWHKIITVELKTDQMTLQWSSKGISKCDVKFCSIVLKIVLAIQLTAHRRGLHLKSALSMKKNQDMIKQKINQIEKKNVDKQNSFPY